MYVGLVSYHLLSSVSVLLIEKQEIVQEIVFFFITEMQTKTQEKMSMGRKCLKYTCFLYFLNCISF